MNLGFTRDDAIKILYQLKKGESAETSLESLCTWSWPIKDISELGLSTLFATRHAQIRLPSRPKSESWQSKSKDTRLQIPLFTKMILETEGDQSYFDGFSRKYVSPRVAFILYYWYFKGSLAPLFEGDGERIFSWPGWVLGEWGMRKCKRNEFDQCNRTQLGLPTLWNWKKNYPSFGWITNVHSQTP